jgi:hypothetical protein
MREFTLFSKLDRPFTKPSEPSSVGVMISLIVGLPRGGAPWQLDSLWEGIFK